MMNASFSLQVRISYVDTTLPKALRQKELREVYSFACQCTLCTRAAAADPREALWCPKGCGGICPYPTEGASGSARYVGRHDRRAPGGCAAESD